MSLDCRRSLRAQLAIAVDILHRLTPKDKHDETEDYKVEICGGEEAAPASTEQSPGAEEDRNVFHLRFFLALALILIFECAFVSYVILQRGSPELRAIYARLSARRTKIELTWMQAVAMIPVMVILAIPALVLLVSHVVARYTPNRDHVDMFGGMVMFATLMLFYHCCAMLLTASKYGTKTA